MSRPSEMSRLIETMSDVLRNDNPTIDPLWLLHAATAVVTAQPGASVEQVWDVAEKLAHTLQ